MRVVSGKARGTNLETLEGNNTRPTLDRVKEALFNIIQREVIDAKVLDLFAGSGALGIEALSRGAEFCTFSDKSNEAIQIIKRNISKTHFEEQAKVIKNDYIKVLDSLQGEKFDLVFIDPPYAADIAINAINQILELNLLSEDGIIILETDEENREIDKLKTVNVNLYDLRKYGRVKLLFLNRKG